MKRKYGATRSGKRFRPKTGRRFKRRRVTRGKRRSIYSLPLAGFPKSKLVRLRYVEEIVIDASSSGSVRHVFRANGLFDPNFNVGGHQPKGFDQNMIFYNHYTVLSSKITMTYANKTGGNDIPGYTAILLTDDGTTSIPWTQPYEMFESRYFTGRKPTFAGTERGYIGQKNYLTKTFSAKKFFARKNINSDPELRGTATSDPTEGAFFETVVFPINTNNPSPLVFLVIIEYIALLSEPNDIPTS